VKRVLFVLAVLVAAAGASSRPAHATNECKGLQVCVRVAGPWVVVPTSPRVPRPAVEYQLSCPRRYIVGGLDAELSDRRIDIHFVGKVGSPVNPGITTSRAAVFVATYTGTSARGPTFRPHVGCVPASGGGGGPVPYLNPAAVGAAALPPGEPTTRRVRVLKVRPGASQTGTRACAGAERLVDGWHAIGFYTARPPAASLVASVVARRTLSSNRVTVAVRSGAALRGVRTIVQIGAVCAGGSA
jgi:hypothetical protein